MSFEIQINEKLSLRLRHPEDAEAFFALTNKNRDHLCPWFSWADTTVTSEDTKKYLEEVLEKFEKKTALDLGMYYEDQWIGSMGFHTINISNKWAEIGYWIDKDFEGKGLMSLCVKTMVDYGFNNLHLHRIQIGCDSRNTRSRKIPERLGFTLEATIRENHLSDNEFSDDLIFGLLRKEWSQ